MHTVTRARGAHADYCHVLQATIICVRITNVVALAVLAWSLGFKLTKVCFQCCMLHLLSAVHSKQQLMPCVVSVRL